jgi:hypothetical protein
MPRIRFVPRITLGRDSRIAALVVAVILGLALAAGASADTPPRPRPGGPGPTATPTPAAGSCAVLRVQLNGDQPASHTCLAPAKAERGTDRSAAAIGGTSNCVAGDLMFTEHRNGGGKRLCFYGYGMANLENYLLNVFPPRTWNDQASSFHSGYNTGKFYQDRNGGGSQYSFSFAETFFNLGSWNDRISSVCIYNAAAPCP